jgi:exodeoxyribonuclease VII small subunit
VAGAEELIRVDESLTFEEAFSRLEETVALLENGGLAVDDLVKQFEQGMMLVKLCRERLEAAQIRVSVLTRAVEVEEEEDLAAVDMEV